MLYLVELDSLPGEPAHGHVGYDCVSSDPVSRSVYLALDSDGEALSVADRMFVQGKRIKIHK